MPGTFGTIGNYRNPFTGATWTPIQQQAFKDDPRNAYSYFGNANSITGPQAVSRGFRSFLDRWLPDQFSSYQAQGLLGGNQSFAEFLAGRDPRDEYAGSFPMMSGQSLYARPTRMLRR